MIEYFEYIANVTILLSSLLALAILIKYNTLPLTLKLAGLYLVISASLDIASSSFYETENDNIFFFNLFSLCEILIISCFFDHIFKSLGSKLKVKFLAIPAIIFLIVNAIFIQGVNQFNHYSSLLLSTLILGFCIHFFVLILDKKASNFQFKTLKWFVICLFIFHSISLIFMLFSNVIYNLSRDSQSYLWSFRGLVLLLTKAILLYCFTKLFLKNSKLIGA